MVTLQTFIVYILLFISMYFLSKQGIQRGGIIWILALLVLYSIVFGLRYGVGVDYMEYLNDYSKLQSMGALYQYDDTEFGFKALQSFFALNGIHYTVYFGFIAFLQLLLIFLAFKDDKSIYPYIVMAFCLMCVWLSYANGLRQQLAFCFFAYSIFFQDKRYRAIFLSILLFLAISMHNSAYLLIPVMLVVLLFRKEWFRNVKFQLILLAGAILLGQTQLVKTVLGGLESYMQYFEIFGYDEYFSNKDLQDLMMRQSSRNGVGYYIILVIDVIMIILSRDVKSYYKSQYLTTAYNLYYIGTILHYLLIASSIIQRVNYYFYGFQFIIMAYTLFFCKARKRNLYYVLVGVLILCFIGYMYRMYDNTSAYYFFWQDDLYKVSQ